MKLNQNRNKDRKGERKKERQREKITKSKEQYASKSLKNSIQILDF